MAVDLGGSAADSFAQLPSECLDAILGHLPPNCIALGMRQLSRKWRQRFLQHTTVTLSQGNSYLPPWAVLAKLPSLQCLGHKEQLLAAMARCGDIEAMQQLAQHRDAVGDLFCSDTVLCAAAGSGCLDIVRWLVEEKGCHALASTSKATASAAAGGHVHVLQWLRLPAQTFNWADGTTAAAAGGGHIATLQYLHSNGCGQDAGVPYTAAARCGQLEALRFLRAHGYRWASCTALYIACKHNQPHVVRYIFEDGCLGQDSLDSNFASHSCCMAVEQGHVDVVAELLLQRCPIQHDLCRYAAAAGQRQMLLWLREHGHPWTADTCAAAARRKELQLLQWLRAQTPPCPWDGSVIMALAQARPVHTKLCLEWLLSNGCPWDAAAFRAVQRCPELRGVQFPGVRRSSRRV